MPSVENWKAERDEGLTKSTAVAQALVGRTIAAAVALPHDDDCDGENVLRLTFTDGMQVDIRGGYGGYTGNSCDEYVEYVSIGEVRKPRWSDLFGIDPDYTEGMPTAEWLEANRGEA